MRTLSIKQLSNGEKTDPLMYLSKFQWYYRLKIGAFHANGNIKDSLISHKGHAFSTKDRDNDSNTSGNCAYTWKGGWWYYNCHSSNLNGKNLGQGKSDYTSMCWSTFGSCDSLKSIKMAIRPQ